MTELPQPQQTQPPHTQPPQARPQRRLRSFNLVARPYRWIEYLTFGRMLEKTRFFWLPALLRSRKAIVLGDGDGRFLAKLLHANQEVQVTAIDSSSEMVRLARVRVDPLRSSGGVEFHIADAQGCELPKELFDLIVTHFFLDCFTSPEVNILANRIRESAAPRAIWVVSEFSIPPRGWTRPIATLVVAFLYFAFRVLTGLRVKQLPDYRRALSEAGFILLGQHHFAGGLLVAELWRLK